MQSVTRLAGNSGIKPTLGLVIINASVLRAYGCIEADGKLVEDTPVRLSPRSIFLLINDCNGLASEALLVRGRTSKF